MMGKSLVLKIMNRLSGTSKLSSNNSTPPPRAPTPSRINCPATINLVAALIQKVMINYSPSSKVVKAIMVYWIVGDRVTQKNLSLRKLRQLILCTTLSHQGVKFQHLEM